MPDPSDGSFDSPAAPGLSPRTPKVRQHTRQAAAAWSLYDFANSAFTTLVVTFVYATYFTQGIAADAISGTALWSRGVTITAITVALLSPFLGAWADRRGVRKRFLLLSTAVCVVFTALLALPGEGDVMQALVFVVIANIAYELASVFYNAFLPDVAPPERIGRVSGTGWALGYVGGLLALAIALFVFIQPETAPFGLDTSAGEHVRATNVLVALWFAVFSIPFFLVVKEERAADKPPLGAALHQTARELKRTFAELRRYRQIARLLIARLFYNDGLVTIFAFGGIYAAGTFGFETEDILVFGIVLNVAAGLGAYLFGFVDDRIGGKRTIFISLGILCVATLIAVIGRSESMLWTAGILIGLAAGPNQAASRSLLGRFVPEEKETEFFGFFAFSGKLTAFMGPLLLGLLTDVFDSQRIGLSVIILFFLIGGTLLWTVDEAAGRRLRDDLRKPGNAER